MGNSSSKNIYWLLIHTNKWHAWLSGARSSACGQINVEHLHNNPATKIQVRLKEEDYDAACGRCRHVTDTSILMLAQESRDTRDWFRMIQLHITRKHAIRPDESDVLALAQQLAEIGSQTSAEARGVYEHIKILFLMPILKREDGETYCVLPLKDLIKKLPPSTDALRRVAAAVRCWRRICSGATPGRYHAATVVDVMLQVPNIEPYIQHLHNRGFAALGKIFHPNVLARAKKEGALRGVFAQSNEYWESIRDQLKVVK